MPDSAALYGNLATLVVIGHFAFILFVMFGGLLWLWWKWAPLLHLPCFFWGSYVEIMGKVCPLTPLENRLRRAAGDTPYAGGFIEHYLLPVLYPQGLTRTVQFVLAAGLVLMNIGIYLWVLRRRRSAEGRA